MSTGINPPSTNFDFPTITVASDKIVALTKSLMAERIRYGYDYKAHPLSVQTPGFIGYSDVTGHLGKSVDCSGFSRWAIYHATGLGLAIPDGSVTQHEWVTGHGFKPCDPSDAGNADGVVRISFLGPGQTADGIGHVMLLPGDGYTCESHGGAGPDRRKWGSMGFMERCATYVLALSA